MPAVGFIAEPPSAVCAVETDLRGLRGIRAGPPIAACRTVHDPPLEQGQDHNTHLTEWHNNRVFDAGAYLASFQMPHRS